TGLADPALLPFASPARRLLLADRPGARTVGRGRGCRADLSRRRLCGGLGVRPGGQGRERVRVGRHESRLRRDRVDGRVTARTDGGHMPMVDRGGWGLYVEIVGSGAETIVLTHGLASSADTWRAQVAALAPRYRVVTWDLRAHGRSGSPDEACTLTSLGD